MLWADPCCHGNDIWARRGDPVAYRLAYLFYVSVFPYFWTRKGSPSVTNVVFVILITGFPKIP